MRFASACACSQLGEDRRAVGAGLVADACSLRAGLGELGVVLVASGGRGSLGLFSLLQTALDGLCTCVERRVETRDDEHGDHDEQRDEDDGRPDQVVVRREQRIDVLCTYVEECAQHPDLLQ